MKRVRRFAIKYSISINIGLLIGLCWAVIFPTNCPRVSFLPLEEYVDTAFVRLADDGFEMERYNDFSIDFHGDRIWVNFYTDDGEIRQGGVAAGLSISGEVLSTGIMR
ncbi:MAG: hypothetical protein AAF078_09785 [Planctomycetota bacterium]